MRRLNRYVLLLGPAGILAAGALPAWGQQPPLRAAAVQPTTQPSSAAVGMSTMPSTTASSHRPTTQISMNFDNASIDAVLEQLSQAAGFVVVKTGKLDGRVTVMSKQPVTPEEAVALLNTVLKGNGFTAIQMGRILKIVPVDKAKKGSIPVHFGADADQVDDTDELITQVIPIHTMDAVKLKSDLQPLIGTDADLSANAASNTIIMTDTSANIRRVVQIISSMDQRDSTENGIRVKQLKYADAASAAKLIMDIFKAPSQPNESPQAMFMRAFRSRGRGQQPEEDKGHTGNVVASADQRTNTIVVTGPTDTLKVIDDLLDQIDSNPAADQAFFVYHVKNGQAVDMQNTLNALFTGTTPPNTVQALSNRSSTGNPISSGFGNNGRSGFGGNNTAFGNNQSNRNTSASTSRQPSRSIAGGAAGVAGGMGAVPSGVSELIGQVLVVADQDTNSLLVSTATKYEERVKSLIVDLDRPVPQVLIKVLIAEVTHDNSDDLGLDFSVLNLRASGNGQSIGTNLGNAASATANGGLAVSVLESNLTATFHALATAGKLDVLSRPYILTSDNQEADISVGQQVPFITDTRTDSLGNIINTIQYQNIGISLDVTPHINPDGLVVMDVSPTVSSQSDSTVTLSPGVISPIFNNRSASSRVAIKDNETIVIGGLMQDQKNQTVHSVPILGDIPLLGLLFHRNQVTKTKTELLIFLTPHVAQVPERLKAMSSEEMKSLRLTPSAVEPGTFQDQIRGLQLGGATTEPATPPATDSQ